MNNIIKFKKPQKKNIEELFMESLTERQTEMFFEIIELIQQDIDKLQATLLKKITECELLRLENESLKGENHDSKRIRKETK